MKKTFEAQLDEIVKRENDEGISIREFATRYNLGYRSADSRLRALVSEGKLIEGWRHEGGRKIRVYRLPES